VIALSCRAEWAPGQALLEGVFPGFALLLLFGPEENEPGVTDDFQWDTPELFKE